jgi:hypothetical protein
VKDGEMFYRGNALPMAGNGREQNICTGNAIIKIASWKNQENNRK